MIPGHRIQQDLVADLKADTVLTALLASTSEVRESWYQGADFFYPTVRVSVDDNAAITNRGEQCDHSSLMFTIRCYDEGGSSFGSNKVAEAVNNRLHRRNFHGVGWYSWFRNASYMAPRRVSDKVWMTEVAFTGTVYPETDFTPPVA